ncbi:MAG: TetR/AcrR family transcriptional regulator [Nocardioides sp.]
MPTSPTASAAPLRADARRNHEQVLAAARDVFVRRGAGAPLEDVARRAGVGIATVYRRFGDRDGLLRAVVHRALEDARAAAESAREDSAGDGLDALSRYMHAALDLRVSAVVPVALDHLDLADAETAAAREASAAAMDQLIRDAHDDGSLPPEVSFADIGTLLVRLSRPLPGPVPVEVDDELAHRHLDLVLAGLRSEAHALAGQGLSRDELHRARDAETGGE